VVEPAEFGIDFHAGSDDRTNLPQVRGNLDDEETRRLATAFASPLMLHAKTIKGSLREAARKRGKRMLLFEGGEPRRFNPGPVQAGSDGALRVLHALGMIDASTPSMIETAEARSTKWIRAPRGGIFHLDTHLGARVTRGDLIGVIKEPSGRGGREVRSRASGMIMGHAVNPLVHQGDSLVHVAEM
ncbi:MAG: succinylglutamate desuccinylase/aspartoacylase family protein, partial [Longimicrobiales bacterium]|nr:succinylglutamate desuccinylase/aspartoacylase family protein [Longimicrobiales bacterium]